MAQNPHDLPEDSLASLDEFGQRLFIYPAAVKGFFQKRRAILHFFLILFFLGMPWLKINGQQAILLNLPQRQFSIFGLSFWAHDAPIIFFILGILTLGLALVTAIWGRIWCGWACPQTVFIDSVYRKIESWIEGNHIERRKLNESDLSFSKFLKKSIKWSLYLIVSLILTHSFLAYFVGTTELMNMVTRPPSENWTSFLIIVFTTGCILFDFGWFREQFCLIMCPYGRFQSVLLDEKSLTVAYDSKRGEPRRGVAANKESQGDCINCFKCVASCPTAIDIRRGSQMECIACTACIDACDEVMTKINKPKGLIRYTNEKELSSGLKFNWKKTIFRPRVIIYSLLFMIMCIGLMTSVGRRDLVHASIIRAIEAPYREIPGPDGQTLILNHFKLNLQNQDFSSREITYQILDENIRQRIRLVSPINPVQVKAGDLNRSHFFLEFKPADFSELSTQDISIEFKWTEHGAEQKMTVPIHLIGPNNQ